MPKAGQKVRQKMLKVSNFIWKQLLGITEISKFDTVVPRNIQIFTNITNIDLEMYLFLIYIYRYRIIFWTPFIDYGSTWMVNRFMFRSLCKHCKHAKFRWVNIRLICFTVLKNSATVDFTLRAAAFLTSSSKSTQEKHTHRHTELLADRLGIFVQGHMLCHEEQKQTVSFQLLQL